VGFQAYILIQTEVGRAREVAAAVGDLSEVVRVDAVTGPYDVVALVRARTMDELGAILLRRIQVLDGITRTLTCSVIRSTAEDAATGTDG
jgi:DNA-binding Lrp family transcriptional regulator